MTDQNIDQLLDRVMTQANPELKSELASLESRVQDLQAENEQLRDEKEGLQTELEKTNKGTLQLASELEERYQQLFESGIEGIYTTTATLDEYVMANPAFADLLGYENGEKLCAAVDSIEDEVFVDPDAYATYSETLTSVGELDQFEYRVRTADGKIRWVSDSVTALTDNEGPINGYRGGVTDITDQKKREQSLVRQQQLNTVLLRVFRHNIRNELSVIRGYTNMMIDQLDDGSIDETAATSAIDRVLALAEKSKELDSFLMEEVERKSFDLMALLRQLRTDIKGDYSEASIHVSGPEKLSVSSYPNLKTALRELIENACKHAGESPTVTVSVEVDDERIELTVSDEGPGLPEQEYTVLETGTEEALIHGKGLGLWMVYWIVTGHDGDIDTIVSDEGTTVMITLPQSIMETESNDTGEMVPSSKQSGNIFQRIFEEKADTLVIVDDDGKTLRANESADYLVGLPKSEILGKQFDEFTEDGHEFNTVLRDDRSYGSQREIITMIRPDGSERISECSVTHDVVPGMHLITCRDVTEREKQKRELETVTERLNLALEGANTGVWEWNLETDEVVWTESAETLFGVEVGTFEGTFEGFLKRVHPDDRQNLQDVVEASIEANESFQMEYRIHRDDGEQRWVRAHGEIHDNEGSKRMVGVLSNISDRKERERELSRVKERYETLLAAAPDPVFVADSETGELIEVNDATETLLGMSSDEIIGSYQSELHPSDQADLYQQLFEEHVQTGGTKRRLPDGSHIQIVTSNGEHVPVEISIDTVSLPDGPVTYGIFRDISERVEREKELAEKTQQLKAIVQSTSEAIYIKDTEGSYKFINESGAELFGHTPEEIIGKHDEDLFDPESAADIRADDKQVMESGEEISEETVRFIDGEKHVFLDNKYPYRDADGEIIGMIGISPDISERKFTDEPHLSSETADGTQDANSEESNE